MSVMIYCHGCGTQIHESAPACPKCGAQQRTKTSSSKNRIVAAVLALLLGTLGAHKFYLGHIGRGILYLVFWWTAIPTLIALIEGIIYLCMGDEEFNKRYG